MPSNFKIKSTHRTYSVSFGPYLEDLQQEVKDDDIILVDRTVLTLYPAIKNVTSGDRVLGIDANENSKTYESIGRLLTKIVEKGFSKNNRLVAIGGGVTQDITAFSASMLFRGVEWIFYPSNLLTQCDSCIGSKTSVNLGEFKNQLGGFYPPSKIVIDVSFCNTLDEIEIKSGLGEMMHYFLVEGVDDLSFLHGEITQACKDKSKLHELIERSLGIKSKMVELDEYDKGPRNVFNYGHTFGHAIESATNYAVPHGIAVSYGMDLANILSAKSGLIDMNLRNKIRPILASISNAKPLPDFPMDSYFSALSKDKKNIGNEIKVILTRGLGDMFKTTLIRSEENERIIESFFKNKLYETDL